MLADAFSLDVWDKLVGKLRGWVEHVVVMLPNLVAAIVVAIAFVWISKYVGRVIERLVHRFTKNLPISQLLGTLARFVTILVGLFIALELLALEKTVTSLLAGVGVIGLALGFAFQDIAANFMSGFIMAIRRPFDVGDLVKVGDFRGTVLTIDLRSTTLRTLDGLSVIVPNKDVSQHHIVNYTHTSERRMDLQVGVNYGEDLERVQTIVVEAVDDLRNRDPKRAVEVFYKGFGESSIDFDVRIWLAASDERTYLQARSDAVIAIKQAFDNAEIAIPFPIRTLDFAADRVGGTALERMRWRAAEPPAAEVHTP